MAPTPLIPTVLLTSDFGGQTQQNILSVEFVQEFKTTKGVFSAELGRASSGGVNVITKSGANRIHGSVYEFLRNDLLDARNFFAARKDELRLNQFGATTGGPIVRNRAFFFLGWEGVREGAAGRSRAKCRPIRYDSECSRPTLCTDRSGADAAVNRKQGRSGPGLPSSQRCENQPREFGDRPAGFQPDRQRYIFVRYTILDAYTVVPAFRR